MLEIIFVIDLEKKQQTHTHTHTHTYIYIYISSWFMNQTSRSSTHVFDELNFQLKFDSFGS